MRAASCLAVLSCLVTPAASQTLYVPAAAHTTGVGGAQWRTDLEVLSTGTSPARFTVALLARGQDNSTPEELSFTVAPGTATRYGDLLGTTFGHDGSGALRIAVTAGSVLVNSRTYNDHPDGTYGQHIAACRAEAAHTADQEVALIHLSRSSDPDAGYRTNVGFVNTTAATLELEIRLLAARGTPLGMVTTSLPPFGYDQITDVFAAVTTADVGDGFAVVRTTTVGGRYLVYASVVDNRSADAVFIPGEALPSAPSSRLAPDDLTYQGAFRLPWQFDWGARGADFDAGGNAGAGSLLVIGNDLERAEFAEVSVPQPLIASDWTELPEAALVTPMTDFGAAVVEAVSPDTAWASGLQWVPAQGTQTTGKLYGSIDQWYGVYDESHPTVWFAERDGSNPRGPWHVGPSELPFHGNKAGDFLFRVPRWYADQYLGGRTMITGKTRGAFNGSQGPTLLAFQPWRSDSPDGDLDAVAVLWYRILYPDCAGPNVGDPALCDYPGFTMCDKWEGGAFLESGNERAIVLFGVKGLGPNHYGGPPFPDACEPDQGYHCDPYERQVVFYDPDELGQAALGERDPWSVVPYVVWRPAELFSRDAEGHTCGQAGGVTVDPDTGRLFLIEKGLGDNNSAVVHVWRY